MSSEESVEITLESSLHHYRTEIPNIIFEMNLDPYEFKAYCVLKMTAGDNGSCFKGTERLCQEIGCQKPKLIEIKRSLMSKGLIKVTKRKHANGSMMPDLITIVDLWVINMKTWLQKYENKRGGNQRLPGVVINDYQGGNLGLPKQEHIEQEQKKQQQAKPVSAAAVFVDYSKKGGEPFRMGSTQHKIHYQDIALGSQPVQSTDLSDAKKPKIYTILENISIPIQDKEEITRNHSIEDVIHAIKWATSPMTVINKSLAAAIKWACKTRPTIPQKKVDIEKVNREYAKKYEGKKSGSVFIEACKESVQIVNGAHVIGIKYAIKTFMEEFRNALTKNNFNLMEA